MLIKSNNTMLDLRQQTRYIYERVITRWTSPVFFHAIQDERLGQTIEQKEQTAAWRWKEEWDGQKLQNNLISWEITYNAFSWSS